MPSVYGFEFRELSMCSKNIGERLLSATIYFDGEPVGFVHEGIDMKPPHFTIPSRLEREWHDALRGFYEMKIRTLSGQAYSLQNVECELFYYLISAMEWEHYFIQESRDTDITLIIYEEIDESLHCRTGGYRTKVLRHIETTSPISTRIHNVQESTSSPGWIETHFMTLSDFHIKKETI